MPFFTAIDSRAEVKGSRDPLGLVPLWSRLGRRFVGNLTTASASARGFTTVLIGYYLAETLADKDDARDARPLDVFLRFEQVAAYTRLYLNNDSGFRGERRARRTREEAKSPAIGIASESQILSDQKTYGLWGLYSTAARSSGLLRHGVPALTSAGREIVERLYLPALRAQGGRLERQLLSLVRQDGRYHIDRQHKDLASALQPLLSLHFSGAERKEFDYYLASGGPDDRTGGDQAQLAALLRTLPANVPFGFEALEHIIAEAHRRPDHATLHEHLQDVLYLEHVIVPFQAAFLFALSRDGQAVTAIATGIKDAWGELGYVKPTGIARIRAEIEAAFGSGEAADRLINVAQALSVGDFEAVLHAALEHNSFVMRIRNGSEPWVRLDGGLLDVRYRDETDSLPERAVLPAIWRSTYFIDALKGIINQIDA